MQRPELPNSNPDQLPNVLPDGSYDFGSGIIGASLAEREEINHLSEELAKDNLVLVYQESKLGRILQLGVDVPAKVWKGLDGRFHGHLNKRFLYPTAALLTLLSAACGQSRASEDSKYSTDNSPTPISTSIESEHPSESSVITPKLLTQAFSEMEGTAKLAVLKATPEGKIETQEKEWTELLDYSEKAWNEEIKFEDLSRDPIKALKFILSYVEWTGIEGSIDLSKTFSRLPLTLSRVKISNLPNGQEYEAILNAFPQKLTIRKNTYMTTLGTFGSPSGPGAVVAFDDFIRAPNPDNIPRMFLGIIPITLAPEQKDPGETSLEDILALNGGNYNEGNITLPSGEKIKGNSIESNFANKEILNALGAYFLDIDPLSREKKLHPDPVIQFPPEEISKLAEGGQYTIEQLPDGRVIAKDPIGNIFTRAKYYLWEKSWKWKTGEEDLKYSLSELAGAFNIVIGTTVDGTEDFRNPRYQEVVREHFSVMMTNGQIMPRVVEKGGWKGGQVSRDLADKLNVVLYLHPGFYPRFFPDFLKSASDEEVINYIDGRIDNLLSLARKVDNGYPPTYLNFANEATWFNNGNVGVYKGDNNPLYRVFGGEKWVAEVYVRIAEKAQEKGLTLGKDLILIYSADTKTFISQEKVKLDHKILLDTKREIAQRLGIPIEEAQLDVALQFHLSNNPADYPHHTKPPTDDEFLAIINLFSDIGQIHLTEFDVKSESQEERMKVMNRFIILAIKSGKVVDINLWNTLRFNGNPDSKYDYGPNGLFSPDYQPTKSYNSVRETLIDLRNQ